MAEGKRPGGLTALAVLNFVFGGLGVIGLFAVLALLKVVEGVAEELAKAGPSTGMVYVSLLLGVVGVGLMLASGVGYLKQKRFLGRTLGNAYGGLSLASTVFNLTLLAQPFGVTTLIGLIYPVLTLILLNTTFKEDLVN